MTSALDGIIVLDLTRYLPGPFATLVLADFGATVVKVEPPEGDPVRFFPPFDPAGVGIGYGALNGGKRSIALDLKNPAGRDLLLRLVEKADVLVEGYRPGVMDRLGVGHDACAARNPRLIYATITGYGQDGPYRDVAGHDLDYQAYAGVLAPNKDMMGAPVVPSVQVADVSGGFAAIAGILFALIARGKTGRGQRVDAALMDAAVVVRAMQLLSFLNGDPDPHAAALLSGRVPCYAIYATQDARYGALGALEPKFWERFCETVGRPEWASRGFELDGELKLEVASLFATRTLAEWTALLEPAACCFAPIREPAEVASDAHVRARGLILSDPAGRAVRTAPPVRLSGTPARPSLQVAAKAGQDNASVLEGTFGLSRDEVETLGDEGAFGARAAQRRE